MQWRGRVSQPLTKNRGRVFQKLWFRRETEQGPKNVQHWQHRKHAKFHKQPKGRSLPEWAYLTSGSMVKIAVFPTLSFASLLFNCRRSATIKKCCTFLQMRTLGTVRCCNKRGKLCEFSATMVAIYFDGIYPTHPADVYMSWKLMRRYLQNTHAHTAAIFVRACVCVRIRVIEILA